MTQVSDKIRKVEKVADLIASKAVKQELSTLRDNREQISLVIGGVDDELKHKLLLNIDRQIAAVSNPEYLRKKGQIYAKFYGKLDEKFIDHILEDLDFEKAFSEIQFQLENELVNLSKSFIEDSPEK